MNARHMAYRTPLNPNAKEKILHVSPNRNNGVDLNLVYEGQLVGQGWNNNPASDIEEYLRGMSKHNYLIVFWGTMENLAKYNRTYLQLLKKFNKG